MAEWQQDGGVTSQDGGFRFARSFFEEVRLKTKWLNKMETVQRDRVK